MTHGTVKQMHSKESPFKLITDLVRSVLIGSLIMVVGVLLGTIIGVVGVGAVALAIGAVAGSRLIIPFAVFCNILVLALTAISAVAGYLVFDWSRVYAMEVVIASIFGYNVGLVLGSLKGRFQEPRDEDTNNGLSVH